MIRPPGLHFRKLLDKEARTNGTVKVGEVLLKEVHGNKELMDSFAYGLCGQTEIIWLPHYKRNWKIVVFILNGQVCSIQKQDFPFLRKKGDCS